MKRNASSRDSDPSGDFEEQQPNRIDLCFRKGRLGEAQSAKPLNQDVCVAGEQQAKLIGRKAVAAGTVRKQHQLLFFDPVLHVTPQNIDVVVELLGITRQIGDNESRVGAS